MTIQQENALLRRALLEAAAADFDAEAPEIPQSFRQEKRMRAMLADPFGYAKRARRPWWRQFVHTAAMAAVAVGLSIALLAALSPTVRAAIKQWFMEIRNSDIVYHFTGEEAQKELPYYTITELPEGYTYAEETGEDGYRCIIYRNSMGDQIVLEYSSMEEGTAFWVSTKDMEVRDIQVNGCPGQVFLSCKTSVSNIIVWADEMANIQFSIDSFANELELLHMAESLSLVKTEKR